MSLYREIAPLPLRVEAYALEGLSLQHPSGWTRRTTVVRLQGEGHEGLGEDVTYQAEEQEAFQAAGASWPLAGSTTLDGFTRLLDAQPLFASPPADPKAVLFRRWAFESAALDLALRQAGTSLHEALGRTPRPVRYAVSPGLGRPPRVDGVRRLRARFPGLELKLDWSPDWDDALLGELAAFGGVRVVDLKGHYRGAFTGPAPDAQAYRRVAEALPDAWLEDPAWDAEPRAALADHRERVTFDAPIGSFADVLKWGPHRALNVKPSRFGRVDELLRVYEYCEAAGVRPYGGGQFELGPGRGQIQVLASLFHPDAANDVSPAGFHCPEPPPDTPSSPLTAGPAPLGFRWAEGEPGGAPGS